MKAIHYDTEGDILAVTFAESEAQPHIGVELTDNIVLYYNPETREPLKLIVVSYRAMAEASLQAPIQLEGLVRAPAAVQATVMMLLRRAPLAAFFQMFERSTPAGQLRNIFTPTAFQMTPSMVG